MKIAVIMHRWSTVGFSMWRSCTCNDHSLVKSVGMIMPIELGKAPPVINYYGEVRSLQ